MSHLHVAERTVLMNAQGIGHARIPVQRLQTPDEIEPVLAAREHVNLTG
jgi:hypothetical protein